MTGLDERDANTRKAEGVTDEMASLDFYRGKENKIERHLDDAQKICLSGLALMTQKEFEEKIGLRNHPHDRLDIKRYVKASGLPMINDAESIEEFKKDADNGLDANRRNEILHAHMSPGEHEKYLQSWNRNLDAWDAFVADLKSRFARNSGSIDVTEDDILTTKAAHKESLVFRFNIKVPATDIPVRVAMELASQFEQNAHILDGGFRMKTLTNEPNDRDGIIIYSTAAAFPHIVQVLWSAFRGNTSYHDRHAEPAIFGGINLKDADGTDLPSIRVCVEPHALGADFMTFNDMQSTILSEALIAYVQTHCDGKKDQLLEDFYFDSEDANTRWSVEFPKFYNQAAKHLLGEDVNVNNIAFFSR